VMTHFLHGASTTYCGGPNASFNLWWQKRVLTQTLQALELDLSSIGTFLRWLYDLRESRGILAVP